MVWWQSAIALVENIFFNKTTKHNEIDINFIKDKISKKEIDMKYMKHKY